MDTATSRADAWDEGWEAAKQVTELNGVKVWAHTVMPHGYQGNPYRTPVGGSATAEDSVRVDDQLEREAATAPPAGYTEATAWQDNYDGMFARWLECDNERLALKDQLRIALQERGRR